LSCLKNLRKAVIVVELVIIFVLISILTVDKVTSYASTKLILNNNIGVITKIISNVEKQKIENQKTAEEKTETENEEVIDDSSDTEDVDYEDSSDDYYDEDYSEEYYESSVSAEDFMIQGVVYYNGLEFTWYSENVLPGGGLEIPGRHSDESGYICDCDGYICVASCDYEYGTVLDTPFGYAKVYDVCPVSGIVDVYVNW